jgi:hypothetical protein
MFGTKQERMITALESIASELHEFNCEIRDMCTEQRNFIDRAKMEADKAPEKVMEMFQQVKALMGGKGNGK